MQGESLTNKRSVNNLGETSQLHYQNTPLLPHMQTRINNYSGALGALEIQGWVQGGIPSRELTRDHKYTPSHRG